MRWLFWEEKKRRTKHEEEEEIPMLSVRRYYYEILLLRYVRTFARPPGPRIGWMEEGGVILVDLLHLHLHLLCTAIPFLNHHFDASCGKGP